MISARAAQVPNILIIAKCVLVAAID